MNDVTKNTYLINRRLILTLIPFRLPMKKKRLTFSKNVYKKENRREGKKVLFGISQGIDILISYPPLPLITYIIFLYKFQHYPKPYSYLYDIIKFVICSSLYYFVTVFGISINLLSGT